ncbi:hypothetical protein [Gracilimonas sp.]|uniref:hypothetical protein n=1 Tax=Gracilimonas sp. TaxID=1974203 RepID=UPI002872A22A|nr:hypothetical protein [Gracilimonas sp.]
MKPIITLISGFFGILFFEGFARLIITFYHRIEFQFYGISYLPSDAWVIIILLSVLVSTWLVTMLVLTVINKNSLIYTCIFGLILFLWRLVEIGNSYNAEPIWYFITVNLLHLIGITLAYQLFKNQYENIKNT